MLFFVKGSKGDVFSCLSIVGLSLKCTVARKRAKEVTQRQNLPGGVILLQWDGEEAFQLVYAEAVVLSSGRWPRE